MDRSDAPDGGWHHDFCADVASGSGSGGAGDSAEPKLFFLYRPGHYDILYKPDSDGSGSGGSK